MGVELESQEVANPPMSTFLRIFLLIVALVVVFGSGLLWVPDLVRPRWPWTIAPFNAAFLGAIYLTELAVDLMPVIYNRWTPGRLIMSVALPFVTIVSLVTLFYLDNFKYDKVATYAWFVAYFGSVGVLGFYMWRYRRQPPAMTVVVPVGWKIYLAVQAIILGLYGVCLLILPANFSGFWPWKIDNFHGQVYSAVFVSGAVGTVVLMQATARLDMFALGIVQVFLGFFSILGLVVVDASQHRVNWQTGGTRLWLTLFGWLFLAGLGLFWLASQTRQKSLAK